MSKQIGRREAATRIAKHRAAVPQKPNPPKGRAVPVVVEEQSSVRKRGGAKYGPPPKNPPHERMQNPTPMGAVVRTQAYTGDGRTRLTARQERQLNRMVVRNADRHVATDLVRDLFSRKGRPTPKRKATR